MIRISVVSKDELFASMLCLEIESMGNEYKAVNERAELVIIDLDSCDTDSACEAQIIGFSRNESSLPKNVAEKCCAVLHRPFLLEELKKLVKDIVIKRAPMDDAPVKKHVPEASQSSFELDRAESLVDIDGEKIHLSANEYAVLEKLYENQALPVSREELNETLSSSGGNMCDVYVCHLRSKLERDGNRKFIFTVRGKGYMLKI